MYSRQRRAEVMHSRQREEHMQSVVDKRSRAPHLDGKHCDLAGETVRAGEGAVGGEAWLMHATPYRTLRGIFCES